MRCFLLIAALAANMATGLAQTQTEEVFRVYTESPRLLLRAQRLRLLKRESERRTMRAEQFRTLISGGARMPEPGLALALDSIVTGNTGSTRQAIEWAMGTAGTGRQIAMVYDWCRPSLTPLQSKALESKLSKAAQGGSESVDAVRDRVFAAIALGDAQPDLAKRTLKDVVVNWWRGQMAPKLELGALMIAGKDLYNLFEILHVVRDNLNIDLRENATHFFGPLPGLYLLGHYPAPYPAAENDYRIPAFKGPGDPDLDVAMFSRAAGLTMVAYDNNSTDSQFLQGWLMMDHFIMRHALGVPYEYLWANPYQPGLSYYHFPLSHHDPRSGGMFLRASWEDDANWFGIVDGQMQLYADGKITLLNPKLKQAPLEFGAAMLVMAAEAAQFPVETEKAGMIFVTGLERRSRYNVEVDDEEMWDTAADPAGTLAIPAAAGLKATVRVSRPR